jgi:hypothetical protein
MEKSDSIAELAKALSSAQGEMKGAHKDSENPFFKSKYADLASVWEAIRAPFAKHGLSVVQTTSEGDKGLMLHTTLIHLSGQFISSGMLVKPVKQDPQGLGSALSYSRRYALSAIAGVYQDDDDANLASNKSSSEKPELSQTKAQDYQDNQHSSTVVTDAQIKRLFAIAKQHNWTNEMVKNYIKTRYEIESTKDLNRFNYDHLIKAIELGPRTQGD